MQKYQSLRLSFLYCREGDTQMNTSDMKCYYEISALEFYKARSRHLVDLFSITASLMRCSYFIYGSPAYSRDSVEAFNHLLFPVNNQRILG
jgi:hypothetical protein